MTGWYGRRCQTLDRWVRASHALSLPHLAFALSSTLLFFVAFFLFQRHLVFAFRESCAVSCEQYATMAKDKTHLRISSFISTLASASISSSSLITSRAIYERRSLPNIFQISALSALSGSDARRLGGGGEGENEGERGRFLGGAPPDRGSAPPDVDPDLAGRGLGTGLLDCDDLAEDETLGIVEDDVLVLNAGLAALPGVLPFGCDLASGCDATSAWMWVPCLERNVPQRKYTHVSSPFSVNSHPKTTHSSVHSAPILALASLPDRTNH